MKTFTITLSNNEQSKTLAQKSFNSSIQNGYDAHIFEAHCGLEAVEYLNSENVFPISDSSYPYFSLYNSWTSVPGTIGCFASHYNLWKVCVDLNESIIVLEHDSIVKKPWSNVSWDGILHLDWEGSLRRRNMRNSTDFYLPVIENSVYRMGFSPQETTGVVSMNCTYAYAIKPHAAQNLITDAKENGWFATDRFIREPIVTIFTIHPKLAEEQPEAVDISTTSF
jgi:GR25 family glycosyltransferase involved in LPS biosynthesis